MSEKSEVEWIEDCRGHPRLRGSGVPESEGSERVSEGKRETFGYLSGGLCLVDVRGYPHPRGIPMNGLEVTVSD